MAIIKFNFKEAKRLADLMESKLQSKALGYGDKCLRLHIADDDAEAIRSLLSQAFILLARSAKERGEGEI